MKKNNLKPFVLFIILIAISSGIYFWKIKNNKKETKNISANQEIQAENEKVEINYVSSGQVFNAINKDNYKIVDVRSKKFFDFEHIESSVNYPLEQEDFSQGLPSDLFPKDKKIIIVDNFDSSRGKGLTQSLSKAGHKTYLLKGGIEDYYNQKLPLISKGNINSALDKTKVNSLTAQEVYEKIENQNEIFHYLDVRKENSFEEKHLEGAINIPLEKIEEDKKNIPIGKILVVDEDPLRSFQAAVRLHDMGIWGVNYLSNSLFDLEKIVKEEIKTQE